MTRSSVAPYIGLVLLGAVVALCRSDEELDHLLLLPDSGRSLRTVQEEKSSHRGGSIAEESDLAILPLRRKRDALDVGKRSAAARRSLGDDVFKSRPGFRSWGGKRGEEVAGKRGKFNNWGGKRSESGEEYWDADDDLRSYFTDLLYYDEKRGGFQSWGGKRDFILDEGGDDDDDDGRGTRRALSQNQFSNWGGKRGRGQFRNWGGKRAGSEDALGRRSSRAQKFRNWGGKRDGDSAYRDDDERRIKDCVDRYEDEVGKLRGAARKSEASADPIDMSRVWAQCREVVSKGGEDEAGAARGQEEVVKAQR